MSLPLFRHRGAALNFEPIPEFDFFFDYRVLNPFKNMGDHMKTVSLGILKYNHPNARRTQGTHGHRLSR